uniref:Uncharacterized protein n=1 Tax=Leptobrachium leishanense TaxID=445787 RepID=A0A8C5M8V0_9ANUR
MFESPLFTRGYRSSLGCMLVVRPTMEDTEGHVVMRDQLDSLLGGIYDFGDNFVPKRKLKIKTITPSQSKCLQKAEDKRPLSESEECFAPSKPHSKSKKKNALLFFKNLKDEMHGQHDTPSVEEHCDTLSMHEEPGVEVVTFNSSERKRNLKTTNGSECKAVTRARLEVHKFGITGFKKEKQRIFEKERAIMLGAKPPKREYLNYKVYQDLVKEKKAARPENNRMEHCVESTIKREKQGYGKSKLRNSKKSRTSSGIVPTGHVGKFKNGALFLSGKDISKIKQSKVVK